MKIINSNKYYSSSEIAQIVGRTRQTIVRWDVYSNILAKNGKTRCIPKPIMISGKRYWSESQKEEVKEFAVNISWGDLVKYNKGSSLKNKISLGDTNND